MMPKPAASPPNSLAEPSVTALDRSRLPRHIAIIMDGNGRWASRKRLPRIMGHREGTESVREVVRACGDLGVEVLTLYSFSTENWLRPKQEVDDLMGLLSAVLRREVQELGRRNVRLRASGRIQGLPLQVQKDLAEATQALRDNTGLLLNLALNYGSRQEILDAVNTLLRQGTPAREIDEAAFSRHLYTAGLPDPDLVIRTSGEMRVSNFLLWQMAYAELYVTPVLWPDFRKKDLEAALEEYRKRRRRFGAL